MSLLLDLIVIMFILVCALRARSKTVYRMVANLLILVAVFTGSFIGSLALRPAVQLIVEPMMERSVAGEMADMVSASVFDDPYKTVEAIDIPALVQKQDKQFAKLTEQYNVKTQDVLNAYANPPQSDMKASEAALKAIVKPAAADLSKGVAYVILFLILMLVFQSVGKKIYEKRTLGTKATRTPLVSVILGVVAGLLWSYILVATLIKCLYPYHFGVLSVLDFQSGVDNAILTRFLVLFNPF